MTIAPHNIRPPATALGTSLREAWLTPRTIAVDFAPLEERVAALHAGPSEPLIIPYYTDALREAEERGEIHRLEIIIYFRGDEAERIDFGFFPSRRAAKRAALGELWRQMSARFPSRYSRAEGEVWIGGRPHRWLTEEFEYERYNAETIGDRLRRGEAVAV